MNPDTITLEKKELAALLEITKKMRSGFLMCAPRFAAGSTGELMVADARDSGIIIGEMESRLKAAPSK